MVEIAAVLVAVVAAIVFVMRMDEDPDRWTARHRSSRRRSREAASAAEGVITDAPAAEATPD